MSESLVQPAQDTRDNKPDDGAVSGSSQNGGGQRASPSLDLDPEHRLIDRLLARLGKIDDAEPIFTPGRRVPRAGVLLAVPALLQSGIFSVAEEVYGHIGPAFYGLRTTMVALLLLALLRIKRPEALKEHAPPDLCRLLGLDRAPEVKTLRRKLTRLAAYKKAEVFGRKLANRMFERWMQENFFKYLRDEFALDALVDYKAEAVGPDRTVPNPERRKVEKLITATRAKLKKVQALYGEAAAANPEGKQPTIRGFKIAHGKLGQSIREIQGRIGVLKEKRSLIPKRVRAGEVAGKTIMQLSRERKHLTNCIKMVAYQAESDLLALLRPHYARADEEGRTLVTSALQSAAEIEVRNSDLRVTLVPLSSAHRNLAVARMCETLNRMDACFPGTNLKLRFGVRS